MEDKSSKKLFDMIVKSGINYVNSAISSKETENYWLDYKTTERDDYSGQRKLFDTDKKNYAKALSAFGNSDGGVLLWGVETGASDSDYASSKKPISNASNFISLLENFTSLLTSPPHQQVEHKIIFENKIKNVGYVVSHIPKSNQRPLQALNDELRYYIRAGSNSLPAPHTFLRSLFGNEPQPNVFTYWHVFPESGVFSGDANSLKVGMILSNAGENIGKNINGYVQVVGEGISIKPKESFREKFSYNICHAPGFLKIGFVAKNDFKLGIEQEIEPMMLYISFKKPPRMCGIQMKALVSCDNQTACRVNREVSKEDLEKVYETYIANNNFNAEKIAKIFNQGMKD